MDYISLHHLHFTELQKKITNALLSVVCILNLHLPWTTMVSISNITEVDVYIVTAQQ